MAFVLTRKWAKPPLHFSRLNSPCHLHLVRERTWKMSRKCNYGDHCIASVAVSPWKTVNGSIKPTLGQHIHPAAEWIPITPSLILTETLWSLNLFIFHYSPCLCQTAQVNTIFFLSIIELNAWIDPRMICFIFNIVISTFGNSLSAIALWLFIT